MILGRGDSSHLALLMSERPDIRSGIYPPRGRFTIPPHSNTASGEDHGAPVPTNRSTSMARPRFHKLIRWAQLFRCGLWQCLDRRIPDQPTLTGEVAAWEQDRNEALVRVDWRFTTADARIKLKRLYPSIVLR